MHWLVFGEKIIYIEEKQESTGYFLSKENAIPLRAYLPSPNFLFPDQKSLNSYAGGQVNHHDRSSYYSFRFLN